MTDPTQPKDAAVDDLAARLVAGDRAALARAITLVESKRGDHRRRALALLAAVAPRARDAIRLGVTGVPGAGKSTLIDALGTLLTSRGHAVAVLAVDPSSVRSGGSILGDKTRMGRLSADPRAFVRPSPAAGTLGGVAARTREAIALVEAAGFDVVLVETVGVGQSEVAVAGMVDFFLVLAAPGTGDELQGIKRGVLELADMIAVNKADGDNLDRARRAAGECRAALHILQPLSPTWSPPVALVSGLTGAGLAEMWEQVLAHKTRMDATGERAAKRAAQGVAAMWARFEESVLAEAKAAAAATGRIPDLEREVREGRLAPEDAAAEMLRCAGG